MGICRDNGHFDAKWAAGRAAWVIVGHAAPIIFSELIRAVKGRRAVARLQAKVPQF